MGDAIQRLCKILTLLLIGVAPSCYAQFNGGVQGTVQDSNGLVVPNATINLINANTGVKTSAVSDDSGVYRFVSLAPGNYIVSATVKGFAAISVSFNLTTDQTRDVPLRLTVAAANSTITVTTEAPLIDTSDSREQETIGTSALGSLPLPDLNPTDVVVLAPGVTGVGNPNFAGTGGTTNFATENILPVSANGRGANANQYIVDGMDVTSTIRPGVINVTPNADTVQEVSVQTNTYTVDYGRASSIQTVMTTKSGSDEYHGMASDLYTSEQLAARGEFGVPQPQKLAPYHVSNMSFTAGGPVIPHKQLFFFAGYEPYLSVGSTGIGLSTYEDPAFVTWAQSVEPDSPEIKLMTNYKPSGATTIGVDATAGQLWANSLPAAAQASCVSGVGDLGVAYDSIPCSTPVLDDGNFNSISFYNGTQYSLRLDKYFSKDRIYGDFYRDTISNGGPAIRPAFSTSDLYYTFNLQANETHTFSSNMLNEAAFGYTRIQGIDDTTGVFTVPIVSVTNLSAGWGQGFADGDYIQHSYHWRDVLTRIVGRHAFKAGFEAWRSDSVALVAPTYSTPSFQFANMIDLINNNPIEETDVSFNPVTGAQEPANFGYKQTTFGIFAEDTWKASNRLTVNYGIRYDNFGNPYSALAGTVVANFHLASGSTFAEQVANGVITQGSHILNHDMNWVFSPRAGFAYNLFGGSKWVVRGGFGVFHDEFTLGNASDAVSSNPPGYVLPVFYNNGSTAAPIFSYGTQNKYPYGFQYPAFVGQPLNSKGGVPGDQLAVGGVDGELASPTGLNWSVAIERQVRSSLVASIGYTGSHGRNLIAAGGNNDNAYYGVDVNLIPGDLVQHPTFNSSGVWTGTGQQTRLNSSFGFIDYQYNSSYSNYDAFIASLKGRLGKHGFLVASYTRSAAKDDCNNYPEGYSATGGTSYDMKQWYSPSPWDAPNHVSLGWSYEIPGAQAGNGFMRRLTTGFLLGSTTVLQSGNPFFVVSSNPLSLIDTTGVTVTSSNYQSELNAGNIAFAPDSGDYAADGDIGASPTATTGIGLSSAVPDVLKYGQKHNRKAYEYTGIVDSGIITHAQFAPPAFKVGGTEGNEKLGAFRNPGYADLDFSVRKNTAISERLSLELRMDIFNAFNRVNLSPVDNNYNDTSANFGTTNTNLPPRYLQFGAKLIF